MKDNKPQENKVLDERALFLSEPEVDIYTSDANVLLSFFINEGKYALHDNEIYKVIPIHKIITLPKIPLEFSGIVYYSGIIWPVLDGGYYFQGNRESKPSSLVLLDSENIKLAISINDIIGQSTYEDQSEIKEITTISSKTKGMVKGVVDNDIALINAEKILEWVEKSMRQNH